MLKRLLLLLALVLAPAALRAQQTDVIRGQVVGPDSQPIPGVTVTVTSISGSVSRTAKTDRAGRFTVTFPGGDGDYLVSYAALGFAPRRFQVKRSADEEILLADARLQRMATVLDPVEVRAPRERVARADGVPPDIGGSEQQLGVGAELPAAGLSDLAAMAATLPGISLVPGQDGGADGFSALGLGADQNQTTLNGMPFGGAGLPRDAAVTSSLALSPYDVSRGGFSGAQVSLRMRGGSNFVTRGASLNLDAPQLQWSDRAAQALGQEYANLSLGGLLAGPLVRDKAFYNLSYQLGRRANDYQSLLNTSRTGLAAAGVSRDSAERLVGILRDASVPVVVGRTPASRLADQGSLLGGIDFAPPSSTTGQSLNLSFNAGWNRQDPANGFATAVPAFDGSRTSWRGGLTGRHTGYLRGLLSETSLGVNAARSWGRPRVALPAGRVRVTSDLGGGESGVQLLSFGGNPTMDFRQETASAGLQHQLSWFSLDNKHRVRLTSELRRDAVTQDQTANRLGTFSFNSLADLEAGQPSSFSRQLSRRRFDAAALIGGASLGDAWRPTKSVQLQYGVRVDGNRFLDRPEANPALAARFGAHNEKVPSRLYLSPRLGFSWTRGTVAQIASFDGAARAPRAVVRGGLGVFQNVPGPGMVGSALSSTGLPGAVRQLTCVGDATPAPDWSAYAADRASIPEECADGSTMPAFADTAPAVSLFAKRWAAPRSVRSNLQWDGPVLDNRFSLNVDVTGSLNLHQPGWADLNFAATPRFALPDEDGRPVFVGESSIVPGTGAVAAREARLDPAFARVAEQRSDLRSRSGQLTLRLAPMRPGTSLSWNLAYVLSDLREQTRGFGGNTASDPRTVEWARSTFDVRHQVTYSLGWNLLDAVRIGWFGSFRSGTPYTPMVAGDVNGDGLANDRAFVFDPAATSDPALAAAMRQLVDHGTGAARECLQRQLGRMAGRNSCEGPWTSTAVLSLGFNPLKVRLPQRASLSFQLANPLGAADLALHGSRGLRGWGQPAQPDAALLYVRGFDPSAQRFRYEVNQRFGATNPATGAMRAPVVLTALLRFDVGPTRERQSLEAQLDRGRRAGGQRMQEGILRAIYGGGGIPNPMATILRQQDSLRLTSIQADSLAALNRWYSIRSDSVWAPVAHFLGDLPDDYDRGDAYQRWLRARRASVDLLSRLAPLVKGLLTPEQRRRLPAGISNYLEPRYLAAIRSGTATFTGGSLPGADAIHSGGTVVGGGGGNVVIIRQ